MTNRTISPGLRHGVAVASVAPATGVRHLLDPVLGDPFPFFAFLLATLFAAFRPRLVLLDLGMPGMDGFEVARRLRQQPGPASPVLVALTGWGQEEDQQRSAEAGFRHHLVEPVEPDALAKLASFIASGGIMNSEEIRR